jgi:cadmium resistance protein CadD (predicted permease)
MNKKLVIAIALLGIAVEILAVVLLLQKRITSSTATPMIIAGMFLGFVPIFVVARRAKR